MLPATARNGAPIFAYVRASRAPVNDRGVIHNPDLVIIADETLAMIPAAEILRGVTGRTVLLIHSREKPEIWKERLAFAGTLLTLSTATESGDIPRFRFAGVSCAGAAARLVEKYSSVTAKAVSDGCSLPPQVAFYRAGAG